MSTALVPENLAKLWREGDRDRAVSFLRKALTPDLTVAEWMIVFNFEHVKPHINSICMEEVFRRTTVPAPSSINVAKATVAEALRKKRSRRSNEEMQLMKEKLFSIVSQEPGSINTVQLSSELTKLGFEKVTTIMVNNMMSDLTKDKKVIFIGGKPKAYRRAKQPTQSAPMIIKKASEAHLS